MLKHFICIVNNKIKAVKMRKESSFSCQKKRSPPFLKDNLPFVSGCHGRMESPLSYNPVFLLF
jgi:hypothetical protein